MRRSEITPRHYDMPGHRVRGGHREADVFEMHWADLSRLCGSVTRILTELFTLLFHLSKLGADTISLAAVVSAPSRVMQGLARAHRWANWVFSRVLALLFLQLLMCAFLLVPAALVIGRERGAGVAAATLAGLAVAVACVYGVGGVLMAATMSAVAWGAAGHDVQGAGQRLVAGVLRATEVLLLLQLSGWAVMALLVTLAVGLGEWACTGRADSPERRQSIVTARLGLFVSMGIFVAFVMTVWALVSQPLEALVEGLHYAPWWFADVTVDGRLQAGRFLALRFSASTDTFAVVAVMLLALLGFVALVFLPSVLLELRTARPR